MCWDSPLTAVQEMLAIRFSDNQLQELPYEVPLFSQESLSGFVPYR